MGPGEVAWDVDRYNLPHGEELAAALIYVTGEERPIDAGKPSTATVAPVAEGAVPQDRPRALDGPSAGVGGRRVLAGQGEG
jgi:hypothetical protein